MTSFMEFIWRERDIIPVVNTLAECGRLITTEHVLSISPLTCVAATRRSPQSAENFMSSQPAIFWILWKEVENKKRKMDAKRDPPGQPICSSPGWSLSVLKWSCLVILWLCLFLKSLRGLQVLSGCTLGFQSTGLGSVSAYNEEAFYTMP